MNVWVEAARLRTLPAALSPVLVGTAAADAFIAWRASAALVVALSIQVGVNYANDYFDAGRGIDPPDRVGPRRVTAAGAVRPEQMRTATVSALIVCAIAGSTLALAVGPELWVVGALCIVAALGYSGGPRPYGAIGLGEVAVFVFFGLVATVGSAYVQDERVSALAVWSALPVGFLAVAILVVNNLRDLVTDARTGKATLAVRLGARRTRLLFRVLVAVAFASLVPIAVTAGNARLAIGFLAAPAVIPPIRSIDAAEPGRLVAALAATARLQLLLAALLAVGLWIS